MTKGKGFMARMRLPKLSKRARRILAVLAAVLLLAVVVLVSSALSKPKAATNPPAAAIRQQTESESLTDQGLSALSANDTGTAETLLQRAVVLNPNNTRAAAALRTVRQSTATNSSGSNSGGTSSGGSGRPGGSSSGSGGASTPPKASPFNAKLDISRLLPVAVAGYTMYPREIVATDAQVTADPPAKDVRVIWAVHDRTTASAAAKFIPAVSKKAYPKNSRTVSVDGASAYLGSDGSRYATAVYVRGRYVFEVIVSLGTPSNDMSPAIQMAREAAASFPDTP